MVFGYQNTNNLYQQPHFSFNAKEKKGILTRPIEEVQTVIESGVNTIINNPNEDIKKKKARKRAIAASSTVLVLGSLTLLLNPRSSEKVGNYLKKVQESLGIKIKQTKNNSIKKSFLKLWKNTLGFAEKSGNVYFNLNSGKDWLIDSICTNKNKEYPEFLKKNSFVNNATKKVDNLVVKIFKTPHQSITKWFDKISKNTVKNKYKRSLKEMNSLEISLKSFRDSLPADKRNLVDKKLKEIGKIKKEFNEENVLIRLKKQENMMSDLKESFSKKIYNKEDGWFKNMTSFWARDILEPKKANVQKDGTKLVEKLFGNNDKKGLYDDIVEIVSENLDKNQAQALKIELENARKKLNKANISECVEYFDKKRDLQLGGAPTDILTQIGGIGLCGLAVASADKEDRWSKMFTKGVPIITGLLSSLIFSAKLISGAKSVLYGATVAGIVDLTCRLIDKFVFDNKDDDNVDEEEKQSSKEVKNA